MDSSDARGASPTPDEVRRFLGVFERPDTFEARQRSIRGPGAFDPKTEQMPDPAVVKTIAWLKERFRV